MIEHLPVELRDRFYEIREMDLEVQSKLLFHVFTTINHMKRHFFLLLSFLLDRVDKNWDRQKTFFSNCKDSRRFKPNEREEEYEKIRAEYKKIIEDANDKVNYLKNSVLKMWGGRQK